MTGFFKLQLVTRFQRKESVLFLKTPTVQQEATARLEFKDGGVQTPLWIVVFHHQYDETAITLKETRAQNLTFSQDTEIINTIESIQIDDNIVDVSTISKPLDTYLEEIKAPASVILHTNIGGVFTYNVRKARDIKEVQRKRKRILEERRQNEKEGFSRIRRRINVCVGCDDPNCVNTVQPRKTSSFL